MPLFNVRFDNEGVPTDVQLVNEFLKRKYGYKDGDIRHAIGGTVVTADSTDAELAVVRAREYLEEYNPSADPAGRVKKRGIPFLVVLGETMSEVVDVVRLPDTVDFECGDTIRSNVFVRAKDEDEAKEKALSLYDDGPFFRVFDTKTKKEADVDYMENYLKNTDETWAIEIDPEELLCWAMTQDGDLILLDMEGKYAYAPDRFDIVKED